MIDCGNFDSKLPSVESYVAVALPNLHCQSFLFFSFLFLFFFLFHQVTMAMASTIAGQQTIIPLLMGFKPNEESSWAKIQCDVNVSTMVNP